jgi:hypothetical protein
MLNSPAVENESRRTLRDKSSHLEPRTVKEYQQIFRSVREAQKVRQQVFATLGRLNELKASGRLDALMRSGLRNCENLGNPDKR